MSNPGEAEPGTSDAVRKRKKEIESDTQLINGNPHPGSVDVESGILGFSKKKKGSKRRKDFGLCLITDNGDGLGEYRVSGPFAILSVFIILGVGLLLVKYLDGKLPEALQVSDIAKNPDSFIEERARSDLLKLTAVGVRVAGSDATDSTTVNLLLETLTKIRENLLIEENTLEFEAQRPTGAFFMGSDEGQTSSYTKIANVVAKLEPRDANLRTSESILVNCHFDTKPGSPGATDNMISCVTMLEVLRVLAAERPTSKRNAVIFLFNGAEELGLQGAHGFVKGYDAELGNPNKVPEGHEWAKNLRTFMNLEGAGGGGREILFQTGPGDSWVLEAYAKGSPNPYGVVIAEEAFQRGLIPSDTDFRIFRDFGDLPGLDMAFIKNGWVYHTKWDRVSEIPAGSITHMGNNALGILRHFSQLDFTDIQSSEGKVVFFDVLGLFMIYYPRWAGILIDCLVAVLTLIVIIGSALYKSEKKLRLIPALIWLPISAIFAWGMGVGVGGGLVAVFLNACGYAKPFYSYPTLAIVIFGVPAAMMQIITHSYAQRQSPAQAWMAEKMGLAIVLLVGTFITRAVYIISINLLFSVLFWHLIRFLCKGWPRVITLSYIVTGEFIPFLMSTYLLVTLSDVFVPILGRSGSETNANLFFGLIVSAIVVVLIWNGLVFIFVPFRRRVLWTVLLAWFFVANTVLVFGFIGKVPYQEKTPMRLNIVNVDRTWYERDGVTEQASEAGYWIWPYDSNTKHFFDTFEKFAPEFANVEEFELDYQNCDSLYCAQPFMWPTTGSIENTYWIPHEEPLPSPIRDPVGMTYTISEPDGDRTRRIDFTFGATTQIVIVLSPGPKYKLRQWSLMESIPQSGQLWRGRDTFFIYHGSGMDPEDMTFSCEFQLISDSATDQDPVVTVMYSAFYMHGENLMTPEFRTMVDKLPSWTYTMPWTAVMKMYEIGS